MGKRVTRIGVYDQVTGACLWLGPADCIAIVEPLNLVCVYNPGRGAHSWPLDKVDIQKFYN